MFLGTLLGNLLLGTRFPTLRRADLAAPRDSPVKVNSSPEPSPEPGSQRIWLLRPAPEPLLWLKTPSLRCCGTKLYKELLSAVGKQAVNAAHMQLKGLTVP